MVGICGRDFRLGEEVSGSAVTSVTVMGMLVDEGWSDGLLVCFPIGWGSGWHWGICSCFGWSI